MIKGRIIKGVGGLYYVAAPSLVYECSARGKFRRSGLTPTVGDYVEILPVGESGCKGTIEHICERKNLLVRPRVANVDCAVVQFAAAQPDINYELLDRFLILASVKCIDSVVICINKSDLMSADTEAYISRVYSAYDVIFTSAAENTGIDVLRDKLIDKVTVFAGPSGVGKSSIINAIMPDVLRKTGELSKKIQRGKHTTREVELLEYNKNTFIADSPGFTSLSLDFLKADELKLHFREFASYLEGCFFNDCRHIAEPGCVLKEHVGKEIPPERYERFVDLYNELTQK